MSYTGGALKTEIPDWYAYADFTDDLDASAPLTLAIDSTIRELSVKELQDRMKMISILLFLDDRYKCSFGRVTAYIERNNVVYRDALKYIEKQFEHIGRKTK